MRCTIRDRTVEVSEKIGTETDERVSEREQVELERGNVETGLTGTEDKKGLAETEIRGVSIKTEDRVMSVGTVERGAFRKRLPKTHTAELAKAVLTRRGSRSTEG